MADSTTTTWGREAASVDEIATKLRASCDACNAAKVRCNKVKLGCGRCERLGVTCVYGLSRRTHKSAPRVGDSSAALLSPPLQPASCSIPMSVDQPRFDEFNATFAAALSNDTMDVDKMLDWTLKTPSNLSSGPGSVVHFPTHKSPDVEPANSLSLHESSLSTGTDDAFPDGLDATPQCTCTAELFKKLSTKALVGVLEDDQVVVWEVCISNLRQAIKISESCINCSCIFRNELSIVTIGVLIGRIIQGFNTVLSRDWSPTHTSADGIVASTRHTASSLVGTALSCGMLQVEPDEEHDMKQHLLLLQFRKLMRVLEDLRNTLHQVSSRRGGGGNHAHLMTCQFMHMWLTQKAADVEEKYFPP